MTRKTWTERFEHVDAQAVLTRRAGMEACRQVGENARPVAGVARELGVCWWTVMNAVIKHGTPLVDDPDRVAQLGVDETSMLKATRRAVTRDHAPRRVCERRPSCDSRRDLAGALFRPVTYCPILQVSRAAARVTDVSR